MGLVIQARLPLSHEAMEGQRPDFVPLWRLDHRCFAQGALPFAPMEQLPGRFRLYLGISSEYPDPFMYELGGLK